MKKLALAIVAAATLLIGSIAPASAHWRHHGWGGPGIGPGLALGLFAGTLAAAAAPPIYYGPVDGPPYYYGRPYRVVRYYPPVDPTGTLGDEKKARFPPGLLHAPDTALHRIKFGA